MQHVIFESWIKQNKDKKEEYFLGCWRNWNINFILDNRIVSVLSFLSVIILEEGRRMSFFLEDTCCMVSKCLSLSQMFRKKYVCLLYMEK